MRGLAKLVEGNQGSLITTNAMFRSDLGNDHSSPREPSDDHSPQNPQLALLTEFLTHGHGLGTHASCHLKPLGFG
jgi:hypothetical protein